MPYLNLDLDYFTHPKVERLVDALGTEAFHYPIRLWCYAGKHFPHNGTLEGCSIKQIEKAIGWCGETGKLIDSLVKCGFVKQKGESYQIHDWKDHAGHLSVFKKRAKSAAKKRWDAYATSIASSTRQAMLKKNQAYAPILTNPNQSSPNQTKPIEEKNTVPPAGESSPVSLWKSAEEVIGFLNERTQKKFQARHPNGDPTQGLNAVHSLLKKGYTLANLRQVIANRCLKWRGDPKMEEFLRPETLFRPSKFTSYFGELGKGVTHDAMSGVL